MGIIGQVGQNDKRYTGRRAPVRVRRSLAIGGATILAVACSGLPVRLLAHDPARQDHGQDQAYGMDATTDSAPGPGAAERVTALALGAPQRDQARTAAHALEAYAEKLERAETRRVAAAKTWGLRKVPLRAPEPPATPPRLAPEPGHLTGEGLPPVIVRVPTDQKVVFLTIDDGADKDPELLRMLRELDLPVSGFLSDEVAREDYGFFRDALEDGHHSHNHTINHREMTRLTYAEQRAEICGQQANLTRELDERPTLFRPPYGAYNRDTLRAAADCGIEVVPLWAEEVFPDRIDYGRADRRFHPGDIVLTHFRGEREWDGSMTDMLRRLLDAVSEQGFAIARLEDYV
ncbi:polysaccharide deacetylase family protein [Streptomyces sp. NPDC049879]|uniref:polysaccharide deacetylase family protein n=1 Tax=Streptomyces sp. NPDC049879 TaxID=3365598 RepID=UPI00379E458A